MTFGDALLRRFKGAASSEAFELVCAADSVMAGVVADAERSASKSTWSKARSVKVGADSDDCGATSKRLSAANPDQDFVQETERTSKDAGSSIAWIANSCSLETNSTFFEAEQREVSIVKD